MQTNAPQLIVSIPVEGVYIELFCYICESSKEHHVKNPSLTKDGRVQCLSKCCSCEVMLPMKGVVIEKCGETLCMDSENYGCMFMPIEEWNEKAFLAEIA